MIVATIAALLLVLLGVMTLGFPGAIIADLVAPVVEHLRGLARGSLLAGDRCWPTGLLLSFTAPIAIPFAVYGGLRAFSGNIWPTLVATVLAAWAWSIVVLFVASLF